MSLRIVVTLAAAVQASQVGPLHDGRSQAFDGFREQYARNYAPGSSEYKMRSALFHERLALIELHNSRSEGRMWTAGANKLVDRTEQELASLRGWVNVGGGAAAGGGFSLLASDAQTIAAERAVPSEVDWRSLSMASQVPDQGGCGSCWAVATAAMLQGRTESQLKVNRTFSAQQLVNCVPNPQQCGGTGGCQGATVELAMAYVEMEGLETSEDVAYEGVDGECKQPLSSLLATKNNRVEHSPHGAVESVFAASFIQLNVGRAMKKRGGHSIGLRGWGKLPSNKAHPLMQAVSEGPVAISVAASEWFWYDRGIFNGCKKDIVIDHAVTLFGYGVDQVEGKDVGYWLIRNSWGQDWGEDGFIRLFRHDTSEEDDAYCGTDTDPKAGLACKPYPKEVEVCGMCGMLYDSVTAHFAHSAE